MMFNVLVNISPPPQTFLKSHRLLNAADFDAVFKSVDLKIATPHFLYLIHFGQKSGPRIGFVIAKKKVKTAVKRNLIKRLHREKFRQLQYDLPRCDIVVLANPKANHATKAQCHQSIEKAFKRILDIERQDG
ncbi:MAG: ribonuclease P protein component [Pseudomonadota bacterium]|nr:ribonuclease P protein component [Pseudomonadota bacterium]